MHAQEFNLEKLLGQEIAKMEKSAKTGSYWKTNLHGINIGKFLYCKKSLPNDVEMFHKE